MINRIDVDVYRLFEKAFEDSFGFMLNRIEDCGGSIPEDLRDQGTAADRCWNEFLLALEDLGVRFVDTEDYAQQDEPIKRRKQ